MKRILAFIAIFVSATSTSAQSLDGVWSASNGLTYEVEGNRWAEFSGTQMVDGGTIWNSPQCSIVLRSAYTGHQYCFNHQFRDGALYVQSGIEVITMRRAGRHGDGLGRAPCKTKACFEGRHGSIDPIDPGTPPVAPLDGSPDW